MSTEPLKVVDATKPTPFRPASGQMLRAQLEEANLQLNEWLAMERQAKAEIARWTEIVERLKSVVDLLERPAQVASAPLAKRSGARINWEEQWPELIHDLTRRLARNPGRRALIKEAVTRLGVTEGNAYQAVHGALQHGRLTLQWDCVWLPGTAPAVAPAWLKA